MAGLNHMADQLDPKPGPTTPRTCKRCGAKYPGLSGLCGTCVGRLKAVAARVNPPAGARVSGVKVYRVVIE